MRNRTVHPGEVMAASKFNKVHLTVFLWCFFAIAFDGYDIAMYGVSLPWLMEEWSLTAIQAGAIGSYTLVGMMLGALLFSPIADKFGRKKVLGLCIFLFSLFTAASGLIDSPLLFTIMRFIAALGMGGLMPNAISLMTEYSPKKNRAVIVAAMYCGYSVGGVLASLVGIFVVPGTSWRVLYLLGVIPLLALPFFFRQFPESLSFYILQKQTKKLAKILNSVHPHGRYSESDDYQFFSMKETTKGFPVKKLFKQKRAPSTFAFWLSVFSCLLMVYGLNTWLPKMMQESGYGLSSSLSFNLVLCLGQAAGALIGGYLADKAGHKKVLAGMYLLGACCFAAFGFTTHHALLYLLIGLGGACTVGTQNIANPYISEYYQKEIRATGIGWALGIGRIGAIIAPSLFAFILSTGIDPARAFMTFAIPSLIGALGIMLIQENHASFDLMSKPKSGGIKLQAK
ncbi:aromatic acid/H+ symport family MFS transporter [Bacillus sp. KICET-3]|uniref:MFS transporter n=1 Tax=Bacillus sp. KICET-3 TaxID=3083256 RepID=UPI00295E6C1A|nr:aromatic acid/H+ symport family MFS transporter [Bacillus sp. KICET-3]WOV60498.1 aromatic acid/H+ symport family MFS transporter [Bacillus sp. KICET-3]